MRRQSNALLLHFSKFKKHPTGSHPLITLNYFLYTSPINSLKCSFTQ